MAITTGLTSITSGLTVGIEPLPQVSAPSPDPPAEPPSIPAWQACGTVQAAVGGNPLTVPWPVHLVGDVGVLWVTNSDSSVGGLTANGFTFKHAVEGGGNPTGAITHQYLAMYWCRATSTSMASPIIANDVIGAGSTYAIAVITTYRGCIVSGDPFNAVGGDTTSSASTSVVIPGGVTTLANCLIAFGASDSRDSASANRSTGYTNTDLTDIVAVTDFNTAAGNGGGLYIGHGLKATAGAFGNTTFSLGASAQQGRIWGALKGNP